MGRGAAAACERKVFVRNGGSSLCLCAVQRSGVRYDVTGEQLQRAGLAAENGKQFPQFKVKIEIRIIKEAQSANDHGCHQSKRECCVVTGNEAAADPARSRAAQQPELVGAGTKGQENQAQGASAPHARPNER